MLQSLSHSTGCWMEETKARHEGSWKSSGGKALFERGATSLREVKWRQGGPHCEVIQKLSTPMHLKDQRGSRAAMSLNAPKSMLWNRRLRLPKSYMVSVGLRFCLEICLQTRNPSQRANTRWSTAGRRSRFSSGNMRLKLVLGINHIAAEKNKQSVLSL